MKHEALSDRIAPEPPFLRKPPDSLRSDSIEGLRVYGTGEMLVLGFGRRDLPESAGGLCREQVLDLIDLHHCRTVAFDLTEVLTITPAMVRVLTSVRRRCPLVQLFNASDEICAQLRRANLSQFFEMNVEDFGESACPDAECPAEPGLQETRG